MELQRIDTERHLQPLGIVWAVWSAVTALAGIVIGLVAAGFGGLLTALPSPESGEPVPWWLGMFFGGFGLALAAVCLVVGLLGVLVGVGVTKGRRWALVTACLLGLLQLSNFPIGTLLAVWTFIVAGRELTEPRR
ncbi:MAG: hypothetical protein Q7U06_00795 [Pseudomonadota bacterium]|nr:hypothetical protein [Pseudomonadota bacterium]